MRVGDQRQAPVALPRYPLCIRLGGPQSRSGRVRKVSLPTGIQSPDCPACSKFDEILSKIMGILHEDLCAYMTGSRWIMLRMRNVFSHKFVKKITTHILCSVTFFRKSCCVWDSVKRHGRAGQATVDKVAYGIACWMTEVADTP